MRELARRPAVARSSVNVSQTDQAPDLWRDVLGQARRGRADGLPIVAQVAGRTVGLLDVPRRQLPPAAVPPGVPGDRRRSRSPSACAALREPSGPATG